MVEDSNKKWSRASFRAFSESFTVKQIGEILGLAPTESFSIGDQFLRRLLRLAVTTVFSLSRQFQPVG